MDVPRRLASPRRPPPPPALLAGIVLVALGQVLNAAVYATIGGDGVYYGVRLGRTVPWVHGFPFRLLATGGKPGTGVRVPHPQYLGLGRDGVGPAAGLLGGGSGRRDGARGVLDCAVRADGAAGGLSLTGKKEILKRERRERKKLCCFSSPTKPLENVASHF